MNEPLLSARGLSKSYVMGRRTLEVLRAVDLDVARGEFLALRGASGAGKSTLLHLIGGLDSPNAGEIFFDGQNLAAFSESELTHFRNRRVGFVSWARISQRRRCGETSRQCRRSFVCGPAYLQFPQA